MAGRLVDEVSSSVSLYAFGVGRGVDKAELLRIVGAGGAHPASYYVSHRCLWLQYAAKQALRHLFTNPAELGLAQSCSGLSDVLQSN